MRSIPGLVLLFLSLTGTMTIRAQNAPPNIFQDGEYAVFTGDYNGDGILDVLLRAKTRIVIIDFDIAIPILIKTKPGTLLLQSSGGSYSLLSNPGTEIVGSSIWQPGVYQLIYGDFAGSGIGGMLVQSRTAGETSFTISAQASGAATFVQALTPTSLGVDLGSAGVLTELQDQNDDGRADLVVSQSGLVSAVLLADTNGNFTRSEQASIQAVWFGFLRALSAEDVSLASQYIDASSRERYQQALLNMGGAMTSVRQTLGNFSAVGMSSTHAHFIVDQTVNGVTRLHFVDFVFKDGRWSLVSF